MASSLVSLVSTLVLGSGSAFAVWTQDPVTPTGQYTLIMNSSIDDRLNYNIPEQSLRSALLAYGKLTGMQVSTDPAAISGIKSQALSGKYSQQQALEKLLSGTDLSVQYIDKTSVVVTHPNPVYAQAGDDAQLGDGTQLDTIVVEGGALKDATSGDGFQGTPDWVYETPDSVSVISREAIQNMPNRNARDLLDSVSGVYANRSEAQNPGISINIRGVQDQDRISTMIDGARQNFQRSAHGATQRTYVDTAFIRQVDVEKSSTSGVGSGGSLGGLVNFRTIIADDLIEEGKQWGAEFNAATGTNAFDFDGSGSVAYRIFDNLSILGGVSHKKIGAFEVGKKGDLELYDGVTDGQLFLYSGQEVLTTLLKAELDVNSDMKVTIGWMRNESDYSTGADESLVGANEGEETVINNTFTGALNWNPANDLIDLKLNTYYNHIKNSEIIDWGPIGGQRPREFTMATLGVTLENTSILKTDYGSISFNYGAEAFRDKGETVLKAEYLTADGQDASATFTGSTPSGDRDVASGFASAKLDYGDWLTASAGLRYDYYKISGSVDIYGDGVKVQERYCRRPPRPDDGTCPRGWSYRSTGEILYSKYLADIDKSDGALLPTFNLALKPTDWFQPFIKYSESYRPPTIMESFLNGGHSGGTNIGNYAPNPYLKPESAKTWELGVNISQNGIFSNDDKLRLKVVRFKRDIENYITFGWSYGADAMKDYISYVNLDGTTTMRGIEIEGNYDAGFFYIGGSYTYNTTDWATSYKIAGDPNGRVYHIDLQDPGGPTVLFVQPKQRLVLNAGVRFFEKKLTLGGRMTDVTATEPTLGALLPKETFGVSGYRVFDIYGSYKFNDTAKLSFAVNNLEDLGYVPAIGARDYPAPGRTATVSLNLKF